ncbi:uncharacterized protein BT62DRAFT_674131 [Guyanagaster necrorhizus]|uniref:RRM domain-containing protein n=1 Tax=Guyanagaster necrorhizus TaxID=856835 RepID=A0A9P7W0S1_9AGAR|nr:uncharacterized protein BT62DRAFT_674131 [Guyanagaster necrorhizus MCA 3950]KAG7449261.1 hypothetical protein BT62DRAFT_674131 [Guyanagaster necrorhizus MCA 3950]
MFPSKRLYLRDLPETASEDEIEAFLAPYGKVTEVKIVSGHTYGFVEFASLDDARTVLKTFKEKDFLGRRIIIEFAHPLRKDVAALADANDFVRHERASRGVMRFPVTVTGIPRRICWQELKDFGRLSGQHVVYCDIDRNNHTRGFIEFSSFDKAEIAVEKLNGQILGGAPVKVYIKKPSYLREAKEVSYSRSSSPVRRHLAYLGRDDRRRAARSPGANRTLPMRYPSPIHSYPSCSSYNTDQGPYLPRIQDRYPVLEYSREWCCAYRHEGRDEPCRDYDYDYNYDHYHHTASHPPADYYYLSSDYDDAEYRRWYNDSRYAYH